MRIIIIKRSWKAWRALLWGAALVSSTGLRVVGQGTVLFGNSVPIYDVDGKSLLAGPAFLAELYAAPVGGSLQAIPASITPFLTTTPGYFLSPIDVAIPGVAKGGTATVQVVAWRSSDGSTFEMANHAGGHVGSSSIFEVAGLGPNGTLTGAVLTGLDSFSLHEVPEPSVLCLVLAGAGILLVRHRLHWSV